MSGQRQRGRPVKGLDVWHIGRASDLLRNARVMLREAGAHNAAVAVNRAIKSVDGALRNAQGHYNRPRKEGKR